MIARVFPRRTRATPTDALAFVGAPPTDLPTGIDEVHVSVSFSWDLDFAKVLAEKWCAVAPTRIGGPAAGTRGEAFTPGVYLADGYTITSRGCPNRCWFCDVWKRDGPIRELPIRDGWNVLDSNLLACTEEHVADVFSMLAQQPMKAQFTGGLDPARVTRDVAQAIRQLKPENMFLAYDTPDDWPHVERAVRLLREAGNPWRGRRIRCYVLIGFPGDTIAAADDRLRKVLATGAFPAAMLYRNKQGRRDASWAAFQRQWFRPAIVGAIRKDLEARGLLT